MKLAFMKLVCPALVLLCFSPADGFGPPSIAASGSRSSLLSLRHGRIGQRFSQPAALALEPEVEEPKGLMKLLTAEPKDPEPPLPDAPGLRRLARAFGGLRFVGGNWFMISLAFDFIAPLKVYSAPVREWLWPIFALGKVWEVMNKAVKRDELADRGIALLNLGLLASLIAIAATPSTGTAAIRAVFALAAAPSAVYTARAGLRGLGRGAVRFDGPPLSVAYGVLALEAFASVFISEVRTMPLLRAVALYDLHRAAAAENQPAELAKEPRRLLNDALMYLGFGLFPSPLKLSFGILSPMMLFFSVTQGSKAGKDEVKRAKEAEKAKASGAPGLAAEEQVVDVEVVE